MSARTEHQVREAYRRAALFLSKLAAREPGRAVQVASATSKEGTTTVVLTLARYLREYYGLKVLVVEVGQRGELAAMLHLDRDRAFDSFASGRIAAAEAVQTGGGVFVVAGSRSPLSAADFTARLRELLKAVAGDFDLVLLDVPPVLESTDALVVGACVPDLVLVVAAGRTRFEVVQRAKRELEAEGVRIIATVLNRHRHFIPYWVYRWLIG